jgi:hypothetical protein
MATRLEDYQDIFPFRDEDVMTLGRGDMCFLYYAMRSCLLEGREIDLEDFKKHFDVAQKGLFARIMERMPRYASWASEGYQGGIGNLDDAVIRSVKLTERPEEDAETMDCASLTGTIKSPTFLTTILFSQDSCPVNVEWILLDSKSLERKVFDYVRKYGTKELRRMQTFMILGLGLTWSSTVALLEKLIEMKVKQ